MSNEANLKGQPFGWLVFGIEDNTHAIVGTQYRIDRPKLDALKSEVACQTTARITFEEIHEFVTPQGRVVLFQIPAAIRGVPTAWKGHFYGRDSESTGPLSVYEIEQIRSQSGLCDWSAEICPDATLADLDPSALAFARLRYREKHPNLADDLDGWDNLTFLHKLKLAFDGRIKRAAIILLGREESTQHISPAVAQATWILKNAHNTELDYTHFYPPFILKVDEVYSKVRNLTLRTMTGGTLFPKEISKYDDWVFREALHNCIAHPDYTQNGRIVLVEQDDSLLFTNRGNFLPGTVESVIERDSPEETNRNSCLASAMVALNMIDTVGSGIKRMFRKQQERFLPMPDYDLTDPKRVKVRIIGKILDERFTRMLMGRTELDLSDVILLDKVQKRIAISVDAYRSLKQQGLIEGRKNAPFISAAIAAVAEQEAEYILNKGIDKEDCKRKVIDYLEQFGSAPLRKFMRLVASHLSATLNETQKRDFVRNLLQDMKRDGVIQRVEGSPTKGAAWELAKPTTEDAV